MALKRIGALWNSEDKNKQPCFISTLGLGVFREARIIIFPNKPKEEDDQPDAIISPVMTMKDNNGRVLKTNDHGPKVMVQRGVKSGGFDEGVGWLVAESGIH